jgi:hypothetical protein
MQMMNLMHQYNLARYFQGYPHHSNKFLFFRYTRLQTAGGCIGSICTHPFGAHQTFQNNEITSDV